MKKLILILLAFVALVAASATRSITANGGRIDDGSMVNYTNGTTSPQLIFADTVKAGRWQIDKRYNFTADFNITTPTLTAPAITFSISVAGTPLNFISSAGMVLGVTGAPMTLTGYLQRRADGTVFVKFNVQQPVTGLLGLSLNSSNVNESTVMNPNLAADIPISLSVSFSTATKNTTLVKQSYARSDF